MTERNSRISLYRSHRRALIDYATPIVGCRARAEDVVQEAFLRFAPEDGSTAAPITQPVAYLYRIVRNLALDGARRLVTETRYHHEEHIPWAVPSAAATPEHVALTRDELRRAQAALAELPEQVRVACQMHRVGGYTFEEVARHLNVSVPKVQRLLRQAVLHVAASLGDPKR